ncbi:hypothetical protein HDU96_007257 [Phlyctochytrium bullatum]|nr:hypothetical protein HDU96_007257 [Phlyctochytrium bullatum]
MTDTLSRRFTTTPTSPRFIHMFPGIVNTDSVTTAGFPWFVRIAAKLALPIVATDPRVLAEEIVYMCTQNDWISNNQISSVSKESGESQARAILVHPGLSVKPPPAVLDDEETERKVVEKTFKLLEEAGWMGDKAHA